MPGSLPVAAVPGDRRHPASGTAEEVAEGNGAPFRAAQKDPGICKASRKRARAPGCGMLCSVRAATAAAAPDGPCPHGACCVCPVPAPQGKRINVSITGSVFASISPMFSFLGPANAADIGGKRGGRRCGKATARVLFSFLAFIRLPCPAPLASCHHVWAMAYSKNE